MSAGGGKSPNVVHVIRAAVDRLPDSEAAQLDEAAKTVAALVEALKALLGRDMRNTCQHENTHRGGVLWEICDDCGAKWADDRGGKPKWKDPAEWDAAFAALKAAGEGL